MISTNALLDEETVIAWAVDRGLVGPAEHVAARTLAGGISNAVIAVEAVDRSFVVKQSMPELRVADSWEFDRARVVTERKALAYLSTVIPGRVPEVVAVDDPQFAFAMTMAPPPAETWKAQLLRGALETGTARAAGETLGLIQVASRGEPLADFDDRMPLVQGRIEPYFLTAARRNPDLADLLRAHAADLVEARHVLTLGDFAPKNLLAYPDGVFLLDLEVAHLGHRAFDPAFLLTHLVLKSLVLPGRGDDLVALATEFWSAYRTTVGPGAATDDEVRTALGALLLARVDGKSPVEYLGSHARAVRDAATRVLRGDAGALDHVARSIHTLGEPR